MTFNYRKCIFIESRDINNIPFFSLSRPSCLFPIIIPLYTCQSSMSLVYIYNTTHTHTQIYVALKWSLSVLWRGAPSFICSFGRMKEALKSKRRLWSRHTALTLAVSSPPHIYTRTAAYNHRRIYSTINELRHRRKTHLYTHTGPRRE